MCSNFIDFFPGLWSYNWHTTLYQFKMYNTMIWFMYCKLISHVKDFSCSISCKKKSACQCRSWKRCSFDPWVGKIPWSRKWQPTPVSLHGKFHRQRNLVGYHPWDHSESDMIEWYIVNYLSDKVLIYKIYKELNS